MCLINRTFSNAKEYTTRTGEEWVPTCFSSVSFMSDTQQHNSATARVMSKTNSLIDFTIKPFLMKRMNIPQYLERASSLQLSRALSIRGIELPSIMALPEDADQ